MKISCKNCEYFTRHYEWAFGYCSMVNNNIPAWEATDKITGSEEVETGVGEDFGCIHFKEKNNEKDKTKS